MRSLAALSFFAILFAVVFSNADSTPPGLFCKQLFESGKTRVQQRRLLEPTNDVSYSSRKVEGYWPATSSPIYYRFDQSNAPAKIRQHQTVMLFHGLGHSSNDVSGIAEQYLKRGFDVLRFDRPGSDRSAYFNKQGELTAPSKIELATMSKAAVEIFEFLRGNGTISSKLVRLSGHSLGGADALVAAIELGKTDNVIAEMDLFAFYPLDLFEFAILNRLVRNPGIQTARVVDEFTKAGATEAINNIQQTTQNAVTSTAAMLQLVGFKQIVQTMLEPAITMTMNVTWRDFFEKRADFYRIPESVRAAWIKYNVDIALADMRGARAFNLFHPSQRMPKPAFPINVIGGTKDPLISPAVTELSVKRLQDLGFETRLREIDGDHFFPQAVPAPAIEKVFGP